MRTWVVHRLDEHVNLWSLINSFDSCQTNALRGLLKRFFTSSLTFAHACAVVYNFCHKNCFAEGTVNDSFRSLNAMCQCVNVFIVSVIAEDLSYVRGRVVYCRSGHLRMPAQYGYLSSSRTLLIALSFSALFDDSIYDLCFAMLYYFGQSILMWNPVSFCSPLYFERVWVIELPHWSAPNHVFSQLFLVISNKYHQVPWLSGLTVQETVHLSLMAASNTLPHRAHHRRVQFTSSIFQAYRRVPDLSCLRLQRFRASCT